MSTTHVQKITGVDSTDLQLSPDNLVFGCLEMDPSNWAFAKKVWDSVCSYNEHMTLEEIKRIVNVNINHMDRMISDPNYGRKQLFDKLGETGFEFRLYTFDEGFDGKLHDAAIFEASRMRDAGQWPWVMSDLDKSEVAPILCDMKLGEAYQFETDSDCGCRRGLLVRCK